MKIIIIGANGVIGSHLSRTLEGEHELIRASANKSEYQIDFTSAESVKEFYKKVGAFDALIVTAGSAPIKAFADMTFEDYENGFRSKLMGQVNLVLEGRKHIKKGGVFTLTSGILANDPIPKGSALSMVNAALNGFVLSASRELAAEDLRLNVVSPGLLEDSAERLQSYFPGHYPVSAQKVIKAYEKSLFGNGNGEVIEVFH